MMSHFLGSLLNSLLKPSRSLDPLQERRTDRSRTAAFMMRSSYDEESEEVVRIDRPLNMEARLFKSDEFSKNFGREGVVS